jgi:serine/threonine protein kinase
MDNYILD